MFIYGCFIINITLRYVYDKNNYHCNIQAIMLTRLINDPKYIINYERVIFLGLFSLSQTFFSRGSSPRGFTPSHIM